MTEPAISIRNLSKCYKLGTIGRHTLVDECQYWWHKLRGRDPREHMTRVGHGATEARKVEAEREGNQEFWALRDVTFDVQPGEVIGIIGRNGAGKSTLLKLLTRITEPTSGEAIINGRVASLLEVGTGFHPELTGRENVFMNGTILGMKKREIEAKFDEIVAFSEIEKFIDTPVKRYSSGMYVRLAFAVAAHLEPEVLLVDEVLAVGDIAFQNKCLGKMEDVVKEGRTILFVSHNMVAVQQLCKRGVVLADGCVQKTGPIRDVIQFYAESTAAPDCSLDLTRRPRQKGSQWLKFTKAEVCDSSGHEVGTIISGQDVHIRLHYESTMEKRQVPLLVAFNVKTRQGHLLANLNSIDIGKNVIDVYSRGYFECIWPRFQLRSGRYDCTVFCSMNREVVDWIEDAFALTVLDGDYYGTGRLVHRSSGDVLIDYSWASRQ